jgi:hypothetical protein
VLGYADDAIIVAAVLRSPYAGALDAVHRHWPGTDDGFAALSRLTELTASQLSAEQSELATQRDGCPSALAGPDQL